MERKAVACGFDYRGFGRHWKVRLRSNLPRAAKFQQPADADPTLIRPVNNLFVSKNR
jgi:hypothetical protein